MTAVLARFRYVSAVDAEGEPIDDASPITLPGTLAAVPGIVEPGDVFEVNLDGDAITHGIDDDGATVEINAAEQILDSIAADPRFERVDDDEPLDLPRASDGRTAAELRAGLEALRDEGDDRVPATLPRTKADLVTLYDDLVPLPPPSMLDDTTVPTEES